MTSDLIHDRGRGPELVGTRITVYNLLPHLLDPTATESLMCRLYELTPEQVAAARAYVLNHADTVLARHREIEARLAAGNPPEVIERAARTHEAFVRFKDWLAARKRAEAEEPTRPVTSNGHPEAEHVPTFREWLARQEVESAKGA